VIEVATSVYALTGLPWHDILWELAAAIAYQLQILYWTRQGHVYLRDQSARIRRRLAREDAAESVGRT
jgi:hypothetical protein